MTDLIITLSKVEKSFADGFSRRKIIHNLSLEIVKGEVFGFIGPNGAGKSTVINLLMGFITPDRGEIRIIDAPADIPRARQNIGYLPEDPRFYGNLNARELLLFGGLASGIKKADVKSGIDPLLSRLELIHVKRRPIHTYSKGMKQRLGLALAMIHDPDVYILDEPMSGLDPIGRSLLKRIILDLKERGKTIFFSTHILNDVEVLCDRIGVIHQGNLLYCGDFKGLANTGHGFEDDFVHLIETSSTPCNQNG